MTQTVKPLWAPRTWSPGAGGLGEDAGTWWMSANDDRPATSPEAVATPDERSAGPNRLLIVEDDWFIAMDIKALVEAAGHEVVGIATSAAEAVATAIEQLPDLVLMDIRLVGPSDGIEAAVAIRAQADLPCIIVSAHQDARLRARAASARPRGWVQKPFSGRQLLAAIEAALTPNPSH
jgi:CheY-like chemotaxis protein